jgi:hypothetical protein
VLGAVAQAASSDWGGGNNSSIQEAAPPTYAEATAAGTSSGARPLDVREGAALLDIQPRVSSDSSAPPSGGLVRRPSRAASRTLVDGPGQLGAAADGLVLLGGASFQYGDEQLDQPLVRGLRSDAATGQVCLRAPCAMCA